MNWYFNPSFIFLFYLALYVLVIFLYRLFSCVLAWSDHSLNDLEFSELIELFMVYCLMFLSHMIVMDVQNSIVYIVSIGRTKSQNTSHVMRSHVWVD